MIIAVDIGSSKTIVALLNGDGDIIKKTKFKTPTGALKCTELIIATIAGEFNNDNIDKIIISIPGVIKNNIIAWATNLGSDWRNYDIAKKLKEAFNINTVIENDANLAGIYEVSKLNELYANTIYLNIGSGIGTGFIINGKLIPGLLNSEAGLTMLEYDGVIREWEKFSSSIAINDAYSAYTNKKDQTDIWNAIADRISRGILVLIPIIQPDAIILGGVMGKYFSKYEHQLELIIDEKLPKDLDKPTLIKCSDPEDAVLKGCFIFAYNDIYLNLK